MNSADFAALEKQLAAALGAQAPKSTTAHYEYYEDFIQSGQNKGKYIADMLVALAKNPDNHLALEKCGYLSIGGADGAEAAYVMENTPIRYGVLQDFSTDLWDKMNHRKDALKQQGKILEIKIGDISQQISACKNQLLQWRSQGLIHGLACSAQAVLHELPSRSPGFDIGFLLGEMFWNWKPCLFFCREPCKPEGWPERVRMSIGAPPLTSELLEPFANQVKQYVGMEGSVLRAGPEHITLPGALAVEMITKFFYLRDYSHELGEQATYWSAEELTGQVTANLGSNLVTNETLTTDSFADRYNHLKVKAYNPTTGALLPIPRVFVRIVGKRWSDVEEEAPAIVANGDAADAEPAGSTLDEARFKRLLGQPESEKLDFKSAPYKLEGEIAKSKLIKDIVAIANTNPPDQPGYIVIGVGDSLGADGKRELRGAPDDTDDAALQDLIRDKIQPPPNFLYYRFQYESHSFSVIEIRTSAHIHQCRRNFGELTEGQVFTRKGSRNSVAFMADVEALQHARNRIFNRAFSPELPLPRTATHTMAGGGVPISGGASPNSPTDEQRAIALGRARALSDGPSYADVAATAENLVLKGGDELAIAFRGGPSRAWKDPSADVIGLWRPSSPAPIIPLVAPLQAVRRAGEEEMKIDDANSGFCIPGFDVEPEFSDRVLVQGPLWSRIKEKVVREFIAARRGLRSIASLIKPAVAQGRPYLLLHCDDYDQWLRDEWPFYRGIESALTKIEAHRRPHIQTMIEGDLRQFVEEELIATGRLADLAPERYKPAFKRRPIDAASAMLVLQGLIQQELKFAVPAPAPSP